MDWHHTWAVSIYRGPSPLALAPLAGRRDPLFSGRDVSDIRCASVADPFLLRRGGTWHMFVEAVNLDTGLGEIAHAESTDLLAWTYRGVVLREPVHLSYPCVFEWNDSVFMVPETRQAAEVRLYVADPFPSRWRRVRTLVTGAYADATIAHANGRWWMFAQRGLDELRLWGADDLDAAWVEHPLSPIAAGNRRITRPAGRLVTLDGGLIRFAQDAWPGYGSRVRALSIDRLTPHDYAEREVPESPVLDASGTGWNALGMHHLDAHQLEDGSWIAAVDGAHFA